MRVSRTIELEAFGIEAYLGLAGYGVLRCFTMALEAWRLVR